MGMNAGHIRSGDIIFVKSAASRKGRRLVQNLNVNGQRVLTAFRRNERIGMTQRLPKHSHVMLGLDGGNIIHADGKTVALEGVEEALNIAGDAVREFRIFRRNNLDPDDGKKIGNEAIRYLHMAYDFKQYLRPRPAPERKDTTQFCSRLVAMAYRCAGVPITDLPDNRVLPVDLWRICQGPNWSEITEDFSSEIEWDKIGDILGPIEIPGYGTVDFKNLFQSSDKLMREVASNSREIIERQRAQADDMLRIESLLVQYSEAWFEMAKLSRHEPSTVDDEVAKWICRIIEQLPQLLALGKLNNISEVLNTSPISVGADDDPNRGAYAGLPTHSEIMRLRACREEIQVCSYLILAEIGMMSIFANVVKNKKLDRFKSVDNAYVKSFVKSVPMVDDFSPFEIFDEDFSWISSEADRRTSRKIAKYIFGCWKIACLLPAVKDRQP